MKIRDDLLAWAIKVGAVTTAMPRWIVALMSAEGLSIPAEWSGWWVVFSAVMSAAMAIVEGLAFSYVFNAWRSAKGRQGNILFALACVSAFVFVAVMTPYVAASVRHVALSEILSVDWVLLAWSACVGASTILIVAATGYAQRATSATQTNATERKAAPTNEATNDSVVAKTNAIARGAFICKVCGNDYGSQQALAGHSRKHAVKTNGHEQVKEIAQ